MTKNYLNGITEDNISMRAAQIRETKISELKEIINEKERLLRGLRLIYFSDPVTLTFKEINVQIKIDALNKKLQILLKK